MGKFSNYIKDTSVGLVEGIRRLVNSRFNRWMVLGLLGAAIVTPLAIPIANVWIYGSLVTAALFAIGRASFNALIHSDSTKPDGADRLNATVATAAVSEDEKSKQQQREQISKLAGKGEKTGDDLTDALIERLRSMKIVVSTNWNAATLLIDTFPDKFESLKENKENIRGLVWNGRVYINPDRVSAEVVIHEYTHIWAEALRQQNHEEWDHIVELLKQETALWNEIKEKYPHLTTDNEIADEVLATYSGRRGYQLLQSHCEEGKTPENVFKSLFAAMESFWKSIAHIFNITSDDYVSISDIADLSLYSLLKGVNPTKSIDPNKMSLSDQVPLGHVEPASSCKIVSLDAFNEKFIRNHKDNDGVLDVSSSTLTNMIVERLKDPSPRAAFSNVQQDTILQIMKDYDTIDDKMNAILPYWRSALSSNDVKGIDEEWKKDVVDELYDLTYGIRRDSENGIKLS